MNKMKVNTLIDAWPTVEEEFEIKQGLYKSYEALRVFMRNKEGFVLGLFFFFAAVRYKKIDQANIQIQFLLFFYSFFFLLLK